MTSPASSSECIYCGLPVPQSIWSQKTSTASYCCTGCRVAHAITSEAGEEGENRWTLTKLGIAIFFSMNVMVLTLALWAYDGTPEDASLQMAESLSDLFRFTCLLLSFPVLVLLGRPLLEQSIDLFKRRALSTDLLILSGVAASFLYSMISVWTGSGSIYFEVGCMILVFVTLGRWLEATGKLRSTEALDQLQRLLPDDVLIEDGDLARKTIPRSELQLGERIIVLAGERIPIDGTIVQGRTTVDEQLLTGESWPVEKACQDEVVGGTLALDGEIVVQVSAAPDDTILQRLVKAVHEARLEVGDYQRLADRITQYFVPATFLLALGTFAFHATTTSLMAGLMAALSVVLIACPCGLGLATPMALWAALGVAVQRGIVFSSTQALEKLATVKAIRFDKTGTLTTGTPEVQAVVTDGQSDIDEINQRAYHLARSSNHVFSQAILHSCQVSTSTLEIQTTNQAGKGLYGIVQGEISPTMLGSLLLAEELGLECPADLLSRAQKAGHEGVPCVFLGWGGQVRGLYLFNEQFRTRAGEMLSSCRERGLNLGILTGDSSRAANRLGDEVGISVLSGLTPSQKQDEIKNVQAKVGPVALVGDGINDAIALSTADVGICLGCGADVSREAADVCLVSDDLTQLPWVLDLSRATIQTIQTNLTWAFTYNGIGMLIAAGGALHPALAALFMVMSSVFVISNSLRLRARFLGDPESQETTSLVPKNAINASTPSQRSAEPQRVGVV